MGILDKFTNQVSGATNHLTKLEQKSQQHSLAHTKKLQEIAVLKQRIELLDVAYRTAETLFERHEDDRVERKMREILDHRHTAEQEMQRLEKSEFEFLA